ncbi:MAG TPA: hypothetical protein PK331_13175 [Gordonia sp. (in: high G+C Gram-positive bacteria)]|uniref:hypothetical protein n=1 Tax=unclassified Gordonia (in: high G+C Gram-positive bacteria) TaxID=2657482 RepID=UPI000FBD2C27|nr:MULTISPECIES: hypothetical protein [unclassified Gordonia (in: high G+C Gram-positive bacteria)]RUP36590.1 MAG: hypothetical protein EKK60_14720 [Gordonia sp. (in: high G+C Gram-positive bacteria)]HNP55998.1 hypothetical protein [Gordonia sp. (in: high G+C Gram-positive bacteria)]HRC51857.1 hypothetical protein [Gordonia sp. (in: high G+C Gram-positive bacteria)]
MSTDADEKTTAETAAPRAPREVVGSIQRYVRRQGGTATALLQPVGEAGVRITLVGGEGGILGDRVVRDEATAQAVVEAVDGLTLADEWNRELVSTATVKPSHWRKMAGWVARQHRFPKARNTAELD